jgi:hypothetical protein
LLRHGEEFGTCNAHRKKMYPLADNRMVRVVPYLHTRAVEGGRLVTSLALLLMQFDTLYLTHCGNGITYTHTS